MKDGGPAFPITHDVYKSGASLRDYFAAKAMQGLLANPEAPANQIAGSLQMNQVEALTMMAYKIADAMLKAREEESE